MDQKKSMQAQSECAELGASRSGQPLRLAGMAVIVVALLAGVWGYRAVMSPARVTDRAEPVAAKVTDPAEPAIPAAVPSQTAPLVAQKPGKSEDRSRGSNQATAAVTVSPGSSELIAAVTKLDFNQPLSPGVVTQIKQNLASIAAQGPGAIPGIRAFLAQNQDINFADANGSSPVGFPSMRSALFDSLRQTGGADAQQLLLDTLRSTADPSEVGLLAKYVDEGAPGQHRQEILTAAKETFDQALKTSASAKEMAPLFDTLRRFGDATVVSELQQALPRWGHYAAIALAGLPDGQGIPALLEEAQNPATRKPPYYLLTLQLLAQAVGQKDEASAGLLQLAQQGLLPAPAWAQIANGLTSAPDYQFGKALKPGNGWHTFSVGSTGEDFYGTPLNAERDAAQIQGRLALIDQLLALNSTPQATQALTQARDTLLKQGAPAR